MSNPKQKRKKPRKDWRKIFIAVFACLMAVLMILPMIVSLLPPARAATSAELQTKISAGKAEAADLASKIRELNNQLKALSGDKSKALQQKELLDQQVTAKEREIANTESIIDQLDQLIVEKELETEATKEKEKLQYELFCQRVRAMEETGTVSYWSILFSAADFSDLLDRATFVSEVMTYDNRLMDELAETRTLLETQQLELEDAQAQQQLQRDGLVSQKVELESALSAASQLVREIQSDEVAFQGARDQLKRDEDAVEAEIKRQQRELQAKMDQGKISFDPGTGWKWPLPSNFRITSYFGNRKHPLTGKPNNHTGTDIAASRGTSIKSARGGVVSISGYNSSYGNYVVVQHDGGIATLYAHMSARSVKEGQVVTQGQELGKVGSTGSSTGNHLHFEFRINGGRADALNYYPSLAGQFIS